MPSYNISVSYSHSDNRRRARCPGEIDARRMQADFHRVTVAMCELSEGGIRRCANAEPRPAARPMSDIRRSYPAARRTDLAEQQIRDEMYHTVYGDLCSESIEGELDRLA